jgi:FtsP/CotA-like multicopper oxidase with cupredoxin domain
VIQWHGLWIPAAIAGTELVQHAVQPREIFTYRFNPPDAETFWYDPHAKETQATGEGLHGALIVRPAGSR